MNAPPRRRGRGNSNPDRWNVYPPSGGTRMGEADRRRRRRRSLRWARCLEASSIEDVASLARAGIAAGLRRGERAGRRRRSLLRGGTPRASLRSSVRSTDPSRRRSPPCSSTNSIETSVVASAATPAEGRSVGHVGAARVSQRPSAACSPRPRGSSSSRVAGRRGRALRVSPRRSPVAATRTTDVRAPGPGAPTHRRDPLPGNAPHASLCRAADALPGVPAAVPQNLLLASMLPPVSLDIAQFVEFPENVVGVRAQRGVSGQRRRRPSRRGGSGSSTPISSWHGRPSERTSQSCGRRRDARPSPAASQIRSRLPVAERFSTTGTRGSTRRPSPSRSPPAR
jgi:hypothetical protein